MSAEATNAPDLPGGVAATLARPSLTDRARHVVASLERDVLDIWRVVRLAFFFIFLLWVTIAFWLWALSVLIGLVRLAIHAVMWTFLWLAGGTAPRPGPPVGIVAGLQQDVRRWWDERTVAYESITRPLARQLALGRRVGRTVWHWSMFHKLVAAIVLSLTIMVPGLYVVPRPHEVQITDDNAVEYDKVTNKTTYLVHALDMHIEGKHREYLNEDAWYLGKINSQGLKSQLQIGRTYRLWVVGIRWYYMPTLYPNIISATEIDARGKVVQAPALLSAPPQGPPPAPAKP